MFTSVYFCSYSCFCASYLASLDHSGLAAFANRSSLVAPMSTASKIHYRHFSVCFVTELPACLAPSTSFLLCYDFVLVVFLESTFLLASRHPSPDLRTLSSRELQDLLLRRPHCHHHRCHRRLRRGRLSFPWKAER